ncbi:hypothetical protein HHX48_03740 [Salinimonas sp. HHU 13199]|uniref:Dihydroneopterin aldolase/epimerase domain-containing protein n=1 Tax=Salinimonas profundi TaxID=2729140 RepID=A0ABR8LKM9_9ALTE|nr:hypothetical protein [Salinimonas profundi]MBD3584847.1 hypothetical protein [Salinimonas profundi]
MTKQKKPLQLPIEYESNDIISINYRHFSLWLREDLLTPLSGVVTEIEFEWSDSAKQDNFNSHLDSIAHYALEIMDSINGTLRAENCKIIYCEVNKFACSVSLVAPLPQVVYQGLQSMPCPERFALPQMTNHDVSATEFVADRRKKCNPKIA